MSERKDITAALVRDILRNGVLKGSDPLPSESDPALANLTRTCVRLQQMVEGSKGAWADDRTVWENVCSAIQLLSDLLPVFRAEEAESLKMGARWRLPDLLAAATDDLKAIDSLIEAVQGVCVRGLPHAPIAQLAPQFQQRTHFAAALAHAFETALPGRSKASAYRFVTQMTPFISGETPDVAAVEQHLKRESRRAST